MADKSLCSIRNDKRLVWTSNLDFKPQTLFFVLFVRPLGRRVAGLIFLPPSLLLSSVRPRHPGKVNKPAPRPVALAPFRDVAWFLIFVISGHERPHCRDLKFYKELI
jgi:hypothetical protein